MYRFALRPLWLLSHVFVITLVVLFVNLGFWQLRRHDERTERNDAVAARSELDPVPVEDLVDPDDIDVENLRYRATSASGTFEADRDLLIDNRSNDGIPGAWVVSPLRLDDGDTVAVSRGFLQFEDGALDPPPVPAGRVDVTGTATPWSDGCGVRLDDGGVPVGASCLDRDSVEQLAGTAVLPVVVQQRASSAGDQGLVPVPLPEPDAGPHRGYAFQWFTFATIGAIGYPLVLRRVARDRARERIPDDDAVSDAFA